MTEERSLDRRILRTQASIREALISLINDKGFDAISVKDITNRAMINRGTFYLHYRDKYDLLQQIEADILLVLENLFQQAQSLNVEDFQNMSEPWPVMVSFFKYLKAQAGLMNAVLGLRGEMAIQNQVKTLLERYLFQDGILAGVDQNLLPVPRDYLISYLVSAHLGVIQLWLQNGCIEAPEEMARILSTLSLRGPSYALRIGK